MKPQPAKGQIRIRAGRDLVEEEEVQPDEDQNRHHEEREPALKLGHSHAPQRSASVAPGKRCTNANSSGCPASTACRWFGLCPELLVVLMIVDSRCPFLH